MITKNIIKAAEKAMPIEEKMNGFFSKKAPRLITLGTLAVVFSLIFWEMPHYSFRVWDPMPIIGNTILIYLAITAAAGLFSSIKKFTMMKFIIADIAVTAVHFLGFYVFCTGSVDLSVTDPYGKLAMWCLEYGVNTYIPALALSLLTGLIITHKKASKSV